MKMTASLRVTTNSMSNDELYNLKIMITENTPTAFIATKRGRTDDAIREKVAAELVAAADESKPKRLV